MKGFASFGDQGAEQGYAGYQSRILGTMIGYDVPLGWDTRVGIGVGYARSDIDGTSFDTSTSIDTYEATAYLVHELGPWFLDGDVSFGQNQYSGKRHISFPGIDRTARADYDGQDYSAFVTTGYHLYTQGFTITPLASIQYTRVNLASYGETGAGDIDLRVNSQGYDFVESGLGIKIAREYQYDHLRVMPEMHFKWLHELDNPTLANTAAFAAAGSSTFTTPGLQTAADTLDLGAGVTLLSCGCVGRRWAVEAVYDHEWRADQYTSEQGMVRFTYRFGSNATGQVAPAAAIAPTP